MPLSGGGAAKAGNRFERLWTVAVLLDVMEGEAESLELEVPGPDSVGTEFRVVVDGVAVWHQVKRQRSGGEWNVERLCRQARLASWWDKVRRGDRFVFVSGTSAGELLTLTERASEADSWAAYREHFLGKGLRRAFDELRSCWGDPPEEAVFHGLERITVRAADEDGLTAENRRRLRTLVTGSPDVAAALLERFVDDRLHRRLTAEDAWAMLADHGIELAPAPGSVAVAGPPARTEPTLLPPEWKAGVEVPVGAGGYLLQGYLLAEEPTPDGGFRRQARALRIGAGTPRYGRYVWVRQVELRPGAPAPAPDRGPLAALVRERQLLDELRSVPALPHTIDAAVTGHRATLVLSWPTSRDGTRPCDCLDILLGAPTHDPWRLSRLLSGFAELAGTLGRLHRLDVSHRDLTPAGIVLLDDGRLVLRDLGLAASTPRAGERTTEGSAPEQRRPGPTPPGPATDVHQLAAALYHLVTGQPPHPTSPLPLSGGVPALPPDVASTLDAALKSEPDERLGLGALAAALRAGGRALVQRSTHAVPDGLPTGADGPGAGPRSAGEDPPQGR